MSKEYRIRWQDKDIKELRRVINKFNAKITRLSRSNPYMKNLLPEKVNYKELKNLINTRADLNRELNALERFSKRGAEKLVKAPLSDNTLITKWQKEELSRRIGLVNRKRKTRLKELDILPAKSRGKELGYTVGQAREYIGMGRIREVSLQPLKTFTRNLTPTEIRMRYKSALEQSQSDYFTKKDYEVRDNYLRGLIENYNENDVVDVINRIQSMNIKDFMNIFYEEGATFEIASPDGRNALKRFEYEGYVETLKSTWL